jgi:hypothetical protein
MVDSKKSAENAQSKTARRCIKCTAGKAFRARAQTAEKPHCAENAQSRCIKCTCIPTVLLGFTGIKSIPISVLGPSFKPVKGGPPRGPRQIENKPGPDPYVQEEAAAFLKELFSTRSEIPVNEISEAAELKKINERTLQRAKRGNGYKSAKRKEPTGEEYWVWIRPL